MTKVRAIFPDADKRVRKSHRLTPVPLAAMPEWNSRIRDWMNL